MSQVDQTRTRREAGTKSRAYWYHDTADRACGRRTRTPSQSSPTIKGEYGRSTGRAGRGSLASSEARQPGQLGSSRPLDCPNRRAAVITVIAVTIAIVVVVGSGINAATAAIAVTAVTVDIAGTGPAGSGRQERAARSARAAAVLVRHQRTMTNQAMFRSLGWNCCKQRTIRIIESLFSLIQLIQLIN